MSAWTGIDAETGEQMSGISHIEQSIRKILTTRVGSRIERREFGSLVPDLIDQPINATTRQRVMAATVQAIARWERRIRVLSVSMSFGSQPSVLIVDLVAAVRASPATPPIRLSVPLR